MINYFFSWCLSERYTLCSARNEFLIYSSKCGHRICSVLEAGNHSPGALTYDRAQQICSSEVHERFQLRQKGTSFIRF